MSVLDIDTVERSPAELTIAEIANLAACERVIERGRQTFLEVGEALLTIRNNRLYREEYITFADYLQARWQLSTAYANRMIQASELAETLAPIGVAIENENQARELGKLTEEQRQEAIERVREAQPDTEQPLPAKAVIAAAKTVGESALKQFMQEPETSEEEDEDEQTAPTWETTADTTEAEPSAAAEPAADAVLVPVSPAKVEIAVFPTDRMGMEALQRAYSRGSIELGRIQAPILLDGKLWITLRYESPPLGSNRLIADSADVVRVAEVDAHHDSLAKVTPEIYKKQVMEARRQVGDFTGLVVNAPNGRFYVIQGESRRYVVGSASPVSVPEASPLPDSLKAKASYSEADYHAREALHEVERAFMDVLFTHDRADLLELPRETPEDESRDASFIARWRPILSALCTSAKPKPALPKDPSCKRCGERRASFQGKCVVCLDAEGETLQKAVTRL